MLGAHSKSSQPLICSWPIRSHRIAKLFIDPCGGGVRGGDGFGVLWGVNEVENDRFGGLCDLAGKLVEDVQYFNFQVKGLSILSVELVMRCLTPAELEGSDNLNLLVYINQT
ncbi:hypothetical protein Tco_1140297 [Tanacetum coccineum]